MSFQLSSGTLDTMAGIFAPAKKPQPVSGGGKGRGASGGTILGLTAASLVQPATRYRPLLQTKRAFGGSSHSAASRRAISTMERTARRAPEVVVRITGRQHGGGHVLANFCYISRLGHGSDKSLELYTSDGDIMRDARDMQVLAQDWHEWEMGGKARRQGATSLSMILSMPSGTNPEKLREAALDFARAEFANRSWVAALHVDRDHPHVHLTFARRDDDGRRFHPDRDDLFRYRQSFAQKLRDRGIEANATPAKARGLDPKHEPIAARKVREKGRVPQIDQSRAERVARCRTKGLADPVAAVLAHQHEATRAAYERSIAELSISPSMVDQAVAGSLERFLSSMTAPEPNSVKAVSQVTLEPDKAGQAFIAEGARTTTEPNTDPLAAALTRSEAMRERLEAERDRPDATEPPRTERGGGSPPGLSDRLRALMAEAARSSMSTSLPGPDDILRQAEERDRAQRERGRSPDKGGPRR